LNIEHILANAFEDFEELGQAITHLVSIAIQHADLYAEMTKTKRIIGGRTALAWMNLATSILYHDMRREASIILNNITLAEDDIDHITPSGVEYEQDQYKDLHTRLRGMDSAVKRILAQKEMIPLNVAELSLIPIAPTLRDLVERIKQDHLSSGVNFTYVSTLVDDQVTVLAEKEWLWKLLDILVNNGIQAMEGRKDREMVFLLDAGQDQVVFQITDTGRGMAPELVESLNNDVPPQISPSGQGLGKGLLLAQAIVEAFGGSLRVHSTSNTGTTMQLYIPVSKDRTPENV
jgi:signal transduction histidine kinase